MRNECHRGSFFIFVHYTGICGKYTVLCLVYCQHPQHPTLTCTPTTSWKAPLQRNERSCCVAAVACCRLAAKALLRNSSPVFLGGTWMGVVFTCGGWEGTVFASNRHGARVSNTQQTGLGNDGPPMTAQRTHFLSSCSVLNPRRIMACPRLP